MTSIGKPLSIGEQYRDDGARVLDRLVDGELSADERRELLLALESEPEGWRRCALAFLEGDAWRRRLSGLGRDEAAQGAAIAAPAPVNTAPVNTAPVKTAPVKTAPANTAPRSGGGATWTRWAEWSLAIAASWFLAFGLGWRWQDALSQPGLEGSAEIVKSASIGGRNSFSAGAGESQAWQTFRVPIGGGEEGESIDLPAVSMPRLDPRWLQTPGPAIPRELVEALKKTGHEILRQRELWPFDLEDGRQLLVPVDQVEVHYVGEQRYQ